ncbi:MAG: hypothetical protein L0Y76_10200 [Ignavibacteria bacterium]|nr:hypothetical protein [Ignavibacteria bacterium]
MKKEIVNKENLKRRKFLGVLGIGTAGLTAGKLVASNSKGIVVNNTINVSIHPDAVVRTKRGKQ